MIFAFLPPLFPQRWRKEASKFKISNLWTLQSSFPSIEGPGTPQFSNPKRKLALSTTAVLVAFGITVLCFGLPHMDPTANALRPRNSQAYATMDAIKNELNQKRDPLWLLISGRTEHEVSVRSERVATVLKQGEQEQLIASYTLPVALWPRPEYQKQNREALSRLVDQRKTLHEAVKTNGFSETSLALADRILDTWKYAADSAGTFWPTNEMSRWIFDKVIARTPTNYYFLGFLNPSTNVATSTASLHALESRLPQEQVWLSGWELLGSGIFSSVKKNMWKLVIPMLSLVMLSLLLAFRAWREVVLSIVVLLLSGAMLLTIMRLAGWSWNLLNLMALPLILGTGVDYSIFMQLALRRYNGDMQVAHKAVGRALLLCGATAIAGFGSLAWSSNAGMASLGAVCAVGIAWNMLISVLLLPWWWTQLRAAKARVTKLNGYMRYRD
jgi:predicted RND superfamily exporter protein